MPQKICKLIKIVFHSEEKQDVNYPTELEVTISKTFPKFCWQSYVCNGYQEEYITESFFFPNSRSVITLSHFYFPKRWNCHINTSKWWRCALWGRKPLCLVWRFGFMKKTEVLIQPSLQWIGWAIETCQIPLCCSLGAWQFFLPLYCLLHALTLTCNSLPLPCLIFLRLSDAFISFFLFSLP